MQDQRRLTLAVMVVLGLCAPAVGASPFSDAAALWQMGADKDSAGPGGPLFIKGNVKLGVELTGADREASLRRGGDGRVARFDGGYLRAGASPLAVTGKEMTLCVRLKDPTGRWDAPLFSKDQPNDPYGNILYGANGQLHYTWRTEPLECRARVMSRSGGPYGFNGESNDQHGLAIYQVGQFALTTLTLDETGLVTLWHNGHKNAGMIDAQRLNVGNALFRVGAKHDESERLDGDIAEILVYDRVVSQEERLRLEGCLLAKWGIGKTPAASVSGVAPTPGLVLHLDADDATAAGSRVGPGGPLAAWKDKSGAGVRLVQNARDHQPQVMPGSQAGKAVVHFGGGQWLDGPAVLPAGCKRFTLVAVWRRSHSTGSQVIFEQSSPGISRRASLLSTGGEGRGQDRVDGVLRLRVPAAYVDPVRWHDVVARFRGPNLELFVDGVLVDEEWPHGGLFEFCAPFLIGAAYDHGRVKAGFQGLIDHVALWNRALKDEEIAALAGGGEEVTRRELEINGPVQESVQYWKPRGYNAWAGDCMPFFHDGTFRLFYLFDRHHHGSKWGQGAHQYAQISSKDLVHWQQQPLAVPIVRQWECSMGTCDCIWHDGVYYMFYTDCGGRCEYKDKPQAGSWIFMATSSDGIHFHKDLKPLVPGGDCTVFRDPATGLFHLVRGGGNRLVSKDLRHWEEIPGDFVTRKAGTTGECPHEFEWNGWFYFILGTNAIWKSRSALGPWEEMQPTIYDGMFVPKVAEFTGNRRILAGFNFERGWAGHLALRELIQYPDGSLGMKFPPELIPASGEPQKLRFVALDGESTGDGSRVRIHAPGKFAAAALCGTAKNVRVTLRVVPQPGAKAFGLCLRGKGDYESGCEIRVEPQRQRVQYGSVASREPAKESTGRAAMGRDFAIENVERLDRPFTLDVVVKGDLIDTCIDGRRTMLTRRDPEPDGDRLFFFAREGDVTFEDIVVRPLCR